MWKAGVGELYDACQHNTWLKKGLFPFIGKEQILLRVYWRQELCFYYYYYFLMTGEYNKKIWKPQGEVFRVAPAELQNYKSCWNSKTAGVGKY